MRHALLANLIFSIFSPLLAQADEPKIEPVLQGGHTYHTSSLALNHDGTRLVTGGYDKIAILWDATTGRKIREFPGHTDWLSSVAISDDGSRIVTGSYDGTAIVWDTATGERLLKTPHFEFFSATSDQVVCSVAISPNGKYAASGGRDNRAVVCDIDAKRIVQVVEDFPGWVTCMAISGDGKSFITGTYGHEPTVQVRANRQVKKLSVEEGIESVAVSHDGRIVAAAAGQAIVWDMAADEELLRLAEPNEEIISVSLSRDGKRLITAGENKTVSIWEIPSGKKQHQLQKPEPYGERFVSVSGDGKIVASIDDDNTPPRLFDPAAGKLIRECGVRADNIEEFAISDDRSLLVTASDESAVVWHASTGRLTRALDGHSEELYAVAISSDGKLVATGGADRTAIVWDRASGEQKQTFRHNEAVRDVAFGPDSSWLFTRQLRDIGTIWDLASGKPLKSFDAGISTPTRDGKQLLGLFSVSMGLFDIEQGKVIRELDDHDHWRLESIDFSGDGKRVITGGPGLVRVWEFATEKLLFEGPVEVDTTDVALNHDGSAMAVVGADGVFRFGTVNGRGKGFRRPIEIGLELRGVALDREGEHAWVAQENGIIRKWRLDDRKELVRLLSAGGGKQWIALAPSGEFMGSVGADKLVEYRDRETGQLVDGTSIKERLRREELNFQAQD